MNAEEAYSRWRGQDYDPEPVTPWQAFKAGFSAGRREGYAKALKDAVRVCELYENSFDHPYPHPDQWKTEVRHKKRAAIAIAESVRALESEG